MAQTCVKRNGGGAPTDPAADFEIVAREDFSPATYLLEVRHPMMARAARPGQFVIVIAHEHGERIPLTIADFDVDRGTITLVIQAAGKSTREMQQLCQVGTRLHSLVGPLGEPSHIGDEKKVICVGGGLGVAPIFPQARAFKENGAYVIGVVGFRTKELVFWEDKFRRYCDEFIICSDDGSVGIKGLVTDGIALAIEQHDDIDALVAIGPPIMMQASAEATRPHGIKTMVSLNPIMVDGTGMCGGCRVLVGGEQKFACVDGPDFDGHLVDFDDLMNRLKRFRDEEQAAMERWSEAAPEAPAAAPPATSEATGPGHGQSLARGDPSVHHGTLRTD
ncbi:MAG: sulfide/dihydroorotate dehydrogenase-like FAD/NAD-binding protein [Alphaproteobacteria bacterium]|jgi:NAD(P)H-flavin reductase|nr:sulfide/dihydroorotate dehydrogenase-like FAD/NAD-binding protein [Alphaproteobacteria bacterium]